MAGFVLKDCVITVNGVDLSDYCSQVEVVGFEHDDVDVTGFGGSGNKEHAKGLNDPSIKLTFHQKFGVGFVDATLWPIAEAEAAVPVTVKPHDASVSATNPLYSMDGILMGYTPLSGSPGDASDTEAMFTNGGAAGVTRAVA